SRRFKANGTEISTAREIVEKLMADRDPPTAILAGNDSEAMPILGALQQRGLSVPGDVSVLGIDNFELICERMEPPLTSIGLPYYEMGKLAIERLFSQDAAGPLIERVPGPLVERDSVAAPRTGTISRQALRA
ncbi:MAG: substrate-binding domain-containing protein, partial [Planctomycetes bacterium]|nr:substrate-binding domain-containing protein [Planctomycetota bacterium]